MIPTVLRCSRMGRAKLVHIRFGNAWFFLFRLLLLDSPADESFPPRSTFYACEWVLQTNHEGEKRIRGNEHQQHRSLWRGSNSHCCWPNQEKKPRRFFFRFLFYFLSFYSSKDPPEKGNESGEGKKGELREQTDGTTIHSPKSWIVTQKHQQ